jgi:hypothetical protein
MNPLFVAWVLTREIDEYTFGDAKSFKTQFSRANDGDQFADLKERLRPVCQRTLRRQVPISPGKNALLPCTTVIFTSATEPVEFAMSCQLFPSCWSSM